MRARFITGDTQGLAVPDDSGDLIVSGLVLNFVPDIAGALCEMSRIARPGGRVGFYVWDYPGGGVEFMRQFWDAATELDPAAAEFAEGGRFRFCEPDALIELAAGAGLTSAGWTRIETHSIFRDFEDFWYPFTLGAGPAPGYCAKLPPERQARLRDLLRERLPSGDGGAISLGLRAWAVVGNAS